MVRTVHTAVQLQAPLVCGTLVKSLFDISLQFIADNIGHVDSLAGFPEQMAVKLFSAAEERHRFIDPHTAHRALHTVFCEACGELVLKSMCLRNRYLLISERMDEIRMFQSLESLDLNGCRLGNNHDIFKYITSEALSRYGQQIILKGIGANCLSDAGLQRLTAPVRLMKKGLENLQISLVNLSLKGFFRNKINLIRSETPLKVFTHSDCKTEGWAEQMEGKSLFERH
ncbi:leucine-rich repeat-containing protein 42-like [Myxocyprinus asiaticus]|uniref:leucine-rich repeat-containing protein 42-like n=1 Tax=Myxocyprinus asiaticus TaxID=70543 RepID=UPI002222B1A8|nr:leucine-rich repeat-containing protein 42-like [Myxocyprinus asiaticus]